MVEVECLAEFGNLLWSVFLVGVHIYSHVLVITSVDSQYAKPLQFCVVLHGFRNNGYDL